MTIPRIIRNVATKSYSIRGHRNDIQEECIAIIGDINVGKSTFIAVLIQRIRQICHQFGWSFCAMDDATIKHYEREYHSPLYLKRRAVKRTFPSEMDDRCPLLYSLVVKQGHKQKTIALAFFDRAGQDLYDFMRNNLDNMELYRYFYTASGIVMLIDPLQIPGIREQAVSVYSKTSSVMPYVKANVSDYISRLAQVIYRCQNLSRSKKINIPLAAVVSKIDLLGEFIFGADSSILQPSRHKGDFDIIDFQNNNDIIEDCIHLHTPHLIQEMSVFKDSAFFGVSALGCNPIPSATAEGGYWLPHEPRPIRIEDPFLWLLWKFGIIQGNKQR